MDGIIGAVKEDIVVGAERKRTMMHIIERDGECNWTH